MYSIEPEYSLRTLGSLVLLFWCFAASVPGVHTASYSFRGKALHGSLTLSLSECPSPAPSLRGLALSSLGEHHQASLGWTFL